MHIIIIIGNQNFMIHNKLLDPEVNTHSMRFGMRKFKLHGISVDLDHTKRRGREFYFKKLNIRALTARHFSTLAKISFYGSIWRCLHGKYGHCSASFFRCRDFSVFFCQTIHFICVLFYFHLKSEVGTRDMTGNLSEDHYTRYITIWIIVYHTVTEFP